MERVFDLNTNINVEGNVFNLCLSFRNSPNICSVFFGGGEGGVLNGGSLWM